MCVLSHFSRVWLFATLWTVARQTPRSMGFSKQEYWSGLPCPPSGDLPDPEIEPRSPVSSAFQVESLPLSHCKPLILGARLKFVFYLCFYLCMGMYVFMYVYVYWYFLHYPKNLRWLRKMCAISVQLSSVQLLSHVRLFVTP